MSGMSTDARFAILDTRRGVNVDCYRTIQALAESAINQAWQQFETPAAHVAWIRSLADQHEARTQRELEREAALPAWLEKAAARYVSRGGLSKEQASEAAGALVSECGNEPLGDPEEMADEDMSYWTNDEGPQP
jgi:hypothetical protein